jgi:multicomponent Na+:H+ antiporter subunit E
MSLLPVNLLIAIAWASVSGDFSGVNMFLGFVAGYFALWFFGELYGDSVYHRKMRASIMLALTFAWDLLVSCVQVFMAVLFQHHRGRNRFVSVPLTVQSDAGIMLLANLITLTPGTLTVDVPPDRSHLLIHAMFADDPQDVIDGIKNGVERRVMELLP